MSALQNAVGWAIILFSVVVMLAMVNALRLLFQSILRGQPDTTHRAHVYALAFANIAMIALYIWSLK